MAQVSRQIYWNVNITFEMDFEKKKKEMYIE